MSSSAIPALSAVFLLVLSASSGSVIPIGGRIDASQVRIQDELGQYHFAHVGGPNSREETRTADGSTRGSYSYVDGNGLIQSAAYVSDPVNGFRVAATNLPAGPPVPAGAPAVAGPAVVAAAPALVASAPALVAAAPAIPAYPGLIVKSSEPAPVSEEPKPEEPAPSTHAASEETSASSAAPEASSEAPAPEPSSEEPAPAPVNPYIPVQDTPEVIAARQQHLAAFEETQARDSAVGTEDSSTGEPTETPETPEPTEASSPATPAAEESSSPSPQPSALLPAAVPAVHILGQFPAVPVAPIAPVAAVAAPAVARVAAVAAPSVAAVALPAPAIGLASATQYRIQDELGQYAFGHAGGPNAREEIKTADGITRGGYSYVDSNGLVQSAEYLADPLNGFRVVATNLPVQPLPSYIPDSPEVAEAKAALFRAQEEHIAKL